MRWSLSTLLVLPMVLRAIDVEPTDRFVWSCYMICFPVSRDFVGKFHDRPLDRPPTDGTSPRLIDLRNAVDAGFDGLSIDLFIEDRYAIPAFQQLVDLVNEHKVPLALSPMFDGFSRPDVTVDAVVAKIADWFARFKDETCVMHCGGKPVILTYAPYGLTPDQWEEILQRLCEKGYNGYWIGEFGRQLTLGPTPDFDGAKPWMAVFDGANTFPPMPSERTRDLVGRYRESFPGKA